MLGRSHTYWDCLVGSSLDFGHRFISVVLHCPKFIRLRTMRYLFCITLSEVHPTSDTALSLWYCLVRSSSDFGHRFIFLVLPCPKFTRLRTPSHLSVITLSEVHSTSDTISSFWYCLVRYSLNFGHYLILLLLPCLKLNRCEKATSICDTVHRNASQLGSLGFLR